MVRLAFWTGKKFDVKVGSLQWIPDGKSIWLKVCLQDLKLISIGSVLGVATWSTINNFIDRMIFVQNRKDLPHELLMSKLYPATLSSLVVK